MNVLNVLAWLRVFGEAVSLIEKLIAATGGVTPKEMEAALRGANESLAQWQALRKEKSGEPPTELAEG